MKKSFFNISSYDLLFPERHFQINFPVQLGKKFLILTLKMGSSEVRKNFKKYDYRGMNLAQRGDNEEKKNLYFHILSHSIHTHTVYQHD